MLKKIIILLLVGLFLSSCDSDGGADVDVPSVAISCEESQCNSSLDGSNVFVFLSKSGCDNLEFETPAAGSSTVSCSSTRCSGEVSSWIDENQNSVDTIKSGSYYICSYIDGNADAQRSVGEMVHESRPLITSSNTIIITDWSENQ